MPSTLSDVAVNVVSGTTAGMTAVLMDYPLDTTKTRMQVYGRTLYKGGYLHCIHSVYTQEGLRAFYKGLPVPLLAQGMENAVIFAVFNTVLTRLRQRSKEKQQQQQKDMAPPPAWRDTQMWAAAACAGAAVSVVLTPVEYVKCNMQVINAQQCQLKRLRCPKLMARAAVCSASSSSLTVSSTLSHAPMGPSQTSQAFCAESVRSMTTTRFVCQAWREGGLRAFYCGFAGTFARAVPGNVAYFVTYEQLKQWLGGRNESGATSATRDSSSTHTSAPCTAPWQSMLAGGLSGCAYWTIFFPADVVKTCMQVDACVARVGFARAFARVYRDCGLRGLYRGWGMAAMRSFPSSAIVFTVYEMCAGFLRREKTSPQTACGPLVTPTARAKPKVMTIAKPSRLRLIAAQNQRRPCAATCLSCGPRDLPRYTLEAV